ncbi:MAG: hypothetical protein WC816_15525 [Sphingomonas sp.]
MKSKTVGIYLTTCMISMPVCMSAFGQDIVPPKTFVMTPGGVSLADGSFTMSDTDLEIGPLTLTRFTLGGQRDPNTPFFGPRVSHNFDIYMAPNHKTVCGDPVPGVCTTFKKPVAHIGASASGTYYETMPPNVVITVTSDDSFSGTLSYDQNGAYVYTNQSGDVYTFNTSVAADGVPYGLRVAHIVFADGRRQDFSYNGTQLKLVTDSLGYAIVFDYNGSGVVTSACGFNLANTYVTSTNTCSGAVLRVIYTYSASSPPLLTGVTDAQGGVTQYDRSSGSSNGFTCIKPPGYSNCKISNTYSTGQYPWQVTQQTLADGAVWKFFYNGDYLKPRDPDKFVDLEPSNRAIVTDPSSKTTVYDFVSSSPYTVTSPSGLVTNYRFEGGWDFQSDPNFAQNFGSALVQATFPEGDQYRASYGIRRALAEQRRVAKPGSGLADVVVQYGQVADCTTPPNTPQNCAKPIWKRDAKGNQTDYTYNGLGQVLSEMEPAPSAGGARPLKLYSYAQKSAYIRNSSGGLVPANSSISMLISQVTCQTIAGSISASCDSAAPQVTTTFEYGADGTANNLRIYGQVVSSGGVSRRTCYGYDWRGKKISETSPRAGLSVCP